MKYTITATITTQIRTLLDNINVKQINNKTMAKYFDDLSLKDMIKQHDFTYMYADDNRYYKSGQRQRELIDAKLKEAGGWNQELVDHWNLHAPGDMEKNNQFKILSWEK